MSFTLYFAGSNGPEFDTLMRDMGCDRLFSQLNDRKHINNFIDTGKHAKLFIDSGAYSVKHSGKTVTLDGYIDYINQIGEDVTCFANLDVIPKTRDLHELNECANAGFENFMYIQQHCKYADKCMAIMHIGESQDILYRYIEYFKQHPQLKFFGLGGVAQLDSESSMRHAIKFCNTIKSQIPYAQVHLFGYTRLNELKYINCDSVDSTTWIKASIYGTVLTPWGRLNISDRRSGAKDSVHNYDTMSRDVVYKFIEDLGFTVDEIKNDSKRRTEYNLRYLMRFAQEYKYTPHKTTKKSII